MASLTTPPAAPGAPATPFALPGVDGKTHSLASARGPNGIVVMFICNHCPYVKAVIDKTVRDMNELRRHGIGAIAVMSNDAAAYPDDSFANMSAFAARHGLTFPYVIDATQEVARAYGAVCTPDYFGFDRDLMLVYRGRLDASGRSSDPAAARELFNAMRDVAKTGRTTAAQHAAVGCSIKWRHP